MEKNKGLNFVKTVILSLSLALCVALLLKYIPSTLIRIIVNVFVMGIAVALTVIFNKDKIIPIVVPTVIAFVMSYFVGVSVIQMIVAVLWIALLVFSLFTNKMTGPFRATLLVVTLSVLLTWILPVTSFSYSLNASKELSEVGLFDFLGYGNVALSYFGNISFYILTIGAFYGVLHGIGGYRSLLDKMTPKTATAKTVVLIVIIVLLTLITAICGTSMGLWLIVPFIVSLVLLMGYDKFTAALVGIGPMLVGLMGNVFSATYIMSDYSIESQNGMGIVNNLLDISQKASSMFSGGNLKIFIVRLLVLALGTAILIVSVLLKTKKENKKISEEDKVYIPEVADKKVKVWPIVVVLDLMVLICALSMTSWSTVFNIKIFEKITDSFANNYGLVFSGVKAFERWTVNELSILVILATIVISLVYKVSLSDVFKNAVKGMKKAFKPALIVVFIYTALVVVSYNPIVLTIVKPLIGKHLNVFTMGLAAFISSVFNVDMYYAASSVLPYATSVISNTGSLTYSGIAVIWQVTFGLASVVAPTSIVLVPVLSYLDISFKDWFKHNWLFILGMLFISLLSLIVLLIVL